MITLYNGELVVGNEHFADGTLKMFNVAVRDHGVQDIHWTYENEGELITIIYLVKHIRDTFKNMDKRCPQITLTVPYMPNARLDRVEDEKQVFTLKHFADVINSLHFTKVYFLDPHSAKACELINNVQVMSPDAYIRKVIEGIKTYINRDIVLCFPDMGAMERYKDIANDTELASTVFYGKKLRNFDTREIVEFGLHQHRGTEGITTPAYFANKVALIIDDIISTGETVVLSASELQECGFQNIFAYCTHLENGYINKETHPENTKLRDALFVGTLSGIYTTDSIYTGKHPKVHVIANV
jgi:ribose-phosphate pyrophosphokinase